MALLSPGLHWTEYRANRKPAFRKCLPWPCSMNWFGTRYRGSPSVSATQLLEDKNPNQNPRRIDFTGGENFWDTPSIFPGKETETEKGKWTAQMPWEKIVFSVLWPKVMLCGFGAQKINWTHHKSNIFQLTLWVKGMLRTTRQKQRNIQLNLPSKTLPSNWYFQYPYWEMRRREKRGGLKNETESEPFWEKPDAERQLSPGTHSSEKGLFV